MTEVVCRASNRVFVGLPLCQSGPGIVIDFSFPTLFTGRNPDYLKLSVQFTTELLAMTTFLRLVPPFLRP